MEGPCLIFRPTCPPRRSSVGINAGEGPEVGDVLESRRKECLKMEVGKCLLLWRRPAWGELRNVRRTERRGVELEGASFVRMKGRSPIEMG